MGFYLETTNYKEDCLCCCRNCNMLVTFWSIFSGLSVSEIAVWEANKRMMTCFTLWSVITKGYIPWTCNNGRTLFLVQYEDRQQTYPVFFSGFGQITLITHFPVNTVVSVTSDGYDLERMITSSIISTRHKPGRHRSFTVCMHVHKRERETQQTFLVHTMMFFFIFRLFLASSFTLHQPFLSVI